MPPPIRSLATGEPLSKPPLGVEGLRNIRRLTVRPIVAIGGLTPENSGALPAAGADGFAVVSAIVGAEDPEVVARKFARLFD